MATTVVLTSLIKQSNGSVIVNFGNGSQLEFETLTKLKEWARIPDLNVELTQQLAIAWALARSSELTNIAQIQNKDFIFDLSLNNPIRVQQIIVY